MSPARERVSSAPSPLKYALAERSDGERNQREFNMATISMRSMIASVANAFLVTTLFVSAPGNTSHAQSTPKRVGILINGSHSPLFESIKKTMLSDFQALGYADGTIVIEPRFAEQKLDRLPELAADLLKAKVDLLVAPGGPAAAASQKATTETPIIFAIVTDPVAIKLVASMDKPGANITGLTSLDPQQAAEQMALLKTILPNMKRIAIMSDATIPGGDAQGMAPIDRANAAAARSLGLEPHVLKIKSAADIDPAIEGARKDGADALLVLEVPIPFSNRKPIAESATRNRLPAMFPGGQSDAGGVITYGTNVANTWRQIPAIADKIFKGTKPGDIPVTVVAKRELIINQQAAQSIGLNLPQDIVKRADRVIQ